jgi:peroxiredoxin (alkyl hydroperoxide reductase subunit C)
MLAPGSDAPDFTLRDDTGEKRSLADFSGGKLLLVFYPGDFSPVCSDQLSVYQEVLPQLEEQGVQVVGVSVDSGFCHAAFKEKLGLSMPLLSDFKPKGEVSRAYEAFFEPADFSNRSLVLVDEERKVAWAHEAENPGEIPGANLIFDALGASS